MKLLKTTAFILMFALGFSLSSTAQDMEGEEQEPTIVSLASQTSSLSTLVKAVKAAGLVETLNGEGPFTVFAPTNDAFAALPEGTLESLLEEGNKDKLKKILTYHVVPGKIMAADLEDGQMVKTVQGNEIKVSLDGGAMINKANVVSADIKASNGVVHVIDTVVMPSDNMKMEEDEMEEDSEY